MGVVGLPSAVTGLAAISIMEEMTFMPGRHGSSKRSQTAGASGLAWRLISKVTVRSAMVSFVVSGLKAALDAPNSRPNSCPSVILRPCFGTTKVVLS